MTDRTFTAVEMQDHAGALPKLRGHMPDCGCSHCGQMDRVAAMLRQGADAESRWEQLKAWHKTRVMETRAVSNDDDAGLIELAELETEMARLEKERTA